MIQDQRRWITFCQPLSYFAIFKRSSLVTSTITKVMKFEALLRKYKKIHTKTWACIPLLYFVFPLKIIYALVEGWLTDLWLWICKKAQTCFKNFYMKRGQDGDLIGIKIPRFFLYFSFIYQLKKSEVWLLTQSGPRLCQLT